MITLEQFVGLQQARFPEAKGELSSLLKSVSLAAKIVHREVNKAGLADILGKMGGINAQGEEQQKLDVFANEQFMDALAKGGECCYLASEELEEGLDLSRSNAYMGGKYMVYFDPLDGSSNIDANVSIGTIFSVYRRVSPVTQELAAEDHQQNGREQVAAGYIIYGSSTMLVYTTGDGVNGFTLDPSIGEFCLSHPKMSMPKDGRTYSINESNYQEFSAAIRALLGYFKDPASGNAKRFTARYIGSLVADFHRNLIQGGVYLYPATLSHPSGKLRLMYEANPLAFIAEQAGGLASDGTRAILDIYPEHLHQRVPLIVGSERLVLLFAEYNAAHFPDAVSPHMHPIF